MLIIIIVPRGSCQFSTTIYQECAVGSSRSTSHRVPEKGFNSWIHQMSSGWRIGNHNQATNEPFGPVPNGRGCNMQVQAEI